MLELLKHLGMKGVSSQYVEPPKNEQAKDSYDKCTLINVGTDDSTRNYTLNLCQYNPKKLSYIVVCDGRSPK